MFFVSGIVSTILIIHVVVSQDPGPGTDTGHTTELRRFSRGVVDQPISLMMYEAAKDNGTVSVRLGPIGSNNFKLNELDTLIIEFMSLEAVNDDYTIELPWTDKLKCKPWDDALCFENLLVHGQEIKITGKKNGTIVPGIEWTCQVWQTDYFKKDPSPPQNLTISFPSSSIVNVKWTHPLFPHTKIRGFEIRLVVIETQVRESWMDQNSTIYHYHFLQEQKEYDTQLKIDPSTMYEIEVYAKNEHGLSLPMKRNFTTPKMRLEQRIPSSIKRSVTSSDFLYYALFFSIIILPLGVWIRNRLINERIRWESKPSSGIEIPLTGSSLPASTEDTRSEDQQLNVQGNGIAAISSRVEIPATPTLSNETSF